ncbi:MAG: hypothetical protein HYY41_07000 [Chloroflexi bacterium]|nr:hypothetical protein [Chloroflexota bacterium]
MNLLEVYVGKHCFGYKEAARLAGEIEQSLPGLQVIMTVIDEVADGDLPDIPATPSYFLDGCLLFLGNPRLEELVSKITSFGQGKGGNHG